MKSSIALTLLWALPCALGLVPSSRELAERQDDAVDWYLYAALYQRPDMPPEDIESAAYFHWGLQATKIGSTGKTTVLYHAVNPDGRWAFEKKVVNPFRQRQLVGRIRIQKLNEGELRRAEQVMQELEVPNREMNPFDDCAMFACKAMQAIQDEVTDFAFDVDSFETTALAYGRKQLKEMGSALEESYAATYRITIAQAEYDADKDVINRNPATLEEINTYKPIPAGEAAMKVGKGATKEAVFFTTDTRLPSEVFENGFEAKGHNYKIEDHISPGMETDGEGSGFVSLYRSRTAVKEMIRATGQTGDQFIYVVGPKGVPEGYYLPGVQWKIKLAPPTKASMAVELEFAASGAIPKQSVLGVYRKKANGRQWKWEENSNANMEMPTGCFGRKRQVGCVNINEAEENVPAVNTGPENGGQTGSEEGGQSVLREDNIEEVYTEFAKTELERMGSAFGLGEDIERAGSSELSALARIDESLTSIGQVGLTFKSILPKLAKIAKGLGKVLFVAGVGEWIREMVVTFRADSRAWEKAAVATSLVPFIGCETREVANVDAGVGTETSNIANFAVCLGSDALLFTPAWPLALLIKGIQAGVNIYLDSQRETLEHAVKKERAEAWTRYQNHTLDSELELVERPQFRYNINSQLKAEALALVVAGTKVAGGLHTITLGNASDHEQGLAIRKRRSYVGALALNIEMCADLTARKDRLADDIVQYAADHLKTARGEFDDLFFEKVAEHLLRETPADPDKGTPSPFGTPEEWKKFRGEADKIRKVSKELPASLAPEYAEKLKAAVRATMTYKPLACAATCQMNTELQCLWTHCGAAEPPSAEQIAASGLQEYANVHTLFDARLDNVSDSCRSSFTGFCKRVQGGMMRQEGSRLWPSKLLCGSMDQIESVTLQNGSLPDPAPDYYKWVQMAPDADELAEKEIDYAAWAQRYGG